MEKGEGTQDDPICEHDEWPGVERGQTSTASINVSNYGQDVYSDHRLVGLWRFYQYEIQTLQLAFDGATTPATQTITYT